MARSLIELDDDELKSYAVDTEARGQQPIADVTIAMAVPCFLFVSEPTHLTSRESAEIVLRQYIREEDDNDAQHLDEDEYLMGDIMYDYDTERLYAIFEIHRKGRTARVGYDHFVTRGIQLHYEARDGRFLPLDRLLCGYVTESGGLPSICKPYRSRNGIQRKVETL